MKKTVALATVILAIGSLPSLARVINVPGDYASVQQAVNHSDDGDTVLVQPGTYYQTFSFTGHRITVGSLFLTTGNVSYIPSTIIDGAAATTVVKFENGEDSTASIVGFTIQNGDTMTGGGIRCSWNSSPTIHYNIITGNSSSRGAGIYCGSNSNPIIRENQIIANECTGWGGGMYCTDSDPVIMNNDITGNSGSTGGGIFCTGNSQPMISGNLIRNNVGSGIYVSGGASPIITSNTISGNSANDGGGIRCVSGATGLICGNLITQNTSGGSLNGGAGIACDNANPIIRDNVIFRNIVSEWNSQAGGILCEDCSPMIVNNVIVQNEAYCGGGIAMISCNSEITNNVLSDNIATYGGGIYMHQAYPRLTNNIIWADSSIINTPEIYLHSPNYSNPTITYCVIQGGWEGIGNLDQDPLFRDPENDDYHLMAVECGDPFDSPCIDAGNPHFLDDTLDCSHGLATSFSDIGAYGGGDASGIVIEVPYNYETIQEAIDHSYDGDTILASYGTYVETIDFKGRDIILGSFFLTTGDTELIPLTVIDGDTGGSVVTFENCEDSTAAIIGFTIRNGLNDYGGGIYCDSANPTIRNNWIVENVATNSGGGIYCNNSASPRIYDNLIGENNAEWGGGIFCWWNCSPIIRSNVIEGNSAGSGAGILCNVGSDPVITNNLIVGNCADIDGGGILCWIGSSATITNNTISRNTATSGGGIHCYISNSIITNSIFWADSAVNGPEIYNYGGSPAFTYCDIQGGWTGQGNIDQDPLFRDPESDDFHLMAVECDNLYDSPCIDAGHPATRDDVLDCWHGLGAARSDLGAYGGSNAWTNIEKPGLIDQAIPTEFNLLQNYPNPFNAVTVIPFQVPIASLVRLDVYNILGQRVAALVDERLEAGIHRILWDAGSLASGLYFCRLETDNFAAIKKMVLIK